VRIGREAVEERLERFFGVATPALAQQFDTIEYIDLRYSNGFSVGWRPVPGAPLQTATERT
jgi:cell division protein FtsQ